MMKQAICGFSLLALAACASDHDKAVASCLSYGQVAGTPAYSKCLMEQDAVNKAASQHTWDEFLGVLGAAAAAGPSTYQTGNCAAIGKC